MKIRMHNVYGFIVGIIVRYPVSVMLIAVLGGVLSLLVAATQLEFHTSRLDLISAGDRYKQLDQAYEREFENPPERIIAVIRAEHPETAKAFATALGRRWEQDPTIEGRALSHRCRGPAEQSPAVSIPRGADGPAAKAARHIKISFRSWRLLPPCSTSSR